MIEEIRDRFLHHISEGESILATFTHIPTGTAGDNVASGVIKQSPALVRKITSEVFESSLVGRIMGSATKSYLHEQQQLEVAKRKASRLLIVAEWTKTVESLLSTISIVQSNLKVNGNSQILRKRFSGATRYKTPEAKMRNGIEKLREIRNEDLVYNSHIPRLLRERETKGEFHLLQSNYPNLIKIRALVSEVEVFLRGELRRYFKSKGIDKWQNHVRDLRHDRGVRWETVAQRKGLNYDLLDGATLGELIELASSERHFFREQFSQEKSVRKGVQLLSEFKKYHHETPEGDVPKSELNVVESIFSMMKNLRKVKR